MKYQQITSGERYIMAALRKQGFSIIAIANSLGRNRSSIYRELDRNSCHHIDGS
jgi:IS30 family transposase